MDQEFADGEPVEFDGIEIVMLVVQFSTDRGKFVVKTGFRIDPTPNARPTMTLDTKATAAPYKKN